VCPLLVFGAGPVPALGVAGAAASTVACNGLAALAMLAWLSRHASPVRLLGAGWALRSDTSRTLLAVALPSALGPVLSNGSIALATAYVGTFGSVALAAYGIAARLEYILVPVTFGIGSALTAMVATNLGASQSARAKRVTWTAAAVVWAVTGAIGVAAALWPAAWMALFTNDPAVQAAGSEYLRIVGGCYAFFGVGLVLFFASQGAGRLGWALGASAARLLVVALGGWFTVHVVAGPPAALYAIIALSLVTLAGVVAVATYAADWAVAGAT
jgi:Na+-driven multidrug efflux pump